MISLVWRLLGGLVMVLALFLGGYGLGNKQAKTSCVAGQVEAQRAAITQTAKEDARREVIGAARETSREQIRSTYKTLKEQANEYVKKIPRLNASTGAGANAEASLFTLACGLDADGLRLWNAANSGAAAPVSGEPHLSLPRSTTRQVGDVAGFVEQSHRGNGAVQPMPEPAGDAGSVQP